ncbi:hypothetical protein EMIT0196MI5_60217 [Pseudomonas sp. IT-196MI5]
MSKTRDNRKIKVHFLMLSTNKYCTPYRNKEIPNIQKIYAKKLLSIGTSHNIKTAHHGRSQYLNLYFQQKAYKPETYSRRITSQKNASEEAS